jgi:hypothetical protein
MSGTALILLAMHATVNVVSPAGQVALEGTPHLLGVLAAAALLAAFGAYQANLHPRRKSVPRRPIAVRRLGKPRERRI